MSPQHHRLLLAEDHPVNRQVAIRQLERLGYQVESVCDGAQAIAAVATGEFDLVLMDCQMPGTDGFTATAAIRQAEQGSGRHLPIVAVTANAMQGDKERCLAAGMDDYLAKPVHQDQLRQMLIRWLSNSPSSQQSTCPLNLEQLRKDFEGDEETVQELLGLFIPTAHGLLEKMQGAAIAEDWAGLLEDIAELRVAAEPMGAQDVLRQIAALEQSGRGKNPEQVKILLVNLEESLIAVENYIASLSG